MRKIIAACATIAALAWGASAGAATVVSADFEDAATGSPYAFDIPNLYVGADFVIGEDGGNKYAALLPLANENPPASLFTVIGYKYQTPEGRKYQTTAKVLSLDLYLGEDGFIAPNGNHSFAIPLSAGWHTFSPGCASPCYLYIHAPDVRIDNLVLSYEPTTVPEPATWAMLIAGFGMVGAVVRSTRTAPSGRRPA